MKVKDCYQQVTPHADLVREDTKIEDVIKVMSRNPASRAVFVVNEKEELVGIVSMQQLLNIMGIEYSKEDSITLIADDDYKLESLTEILKEKLVKRKVPSKALNFGKTENALGNTLRQAITFQSGIPTDRAKEIVKHIKGMKLKVQSQIQEDKIRVSGKNIDDLQAVMKSLNDQDYDFAVQFENYK